MTNILLFKVALQTQRNLKFKPTLCVCVCVCVKTLAQLTSQTKQLYSRNYKYTSLLTRIQHATYCKINCTQYVIYSQTCAGK
jgi:hypothetical protein